MSEKFYYFGDPDPQEFQDQEQIHNNYMKGMKDAVDWEQVKEVQREFHQILGNQEDFSEEEMRMSSRIGLFRGLILKIAEEEMEDTGTVETVALIEELMKQAMKEYVGWLASNVTDEEAEKINFNENKLDEVFTGELVEDE